MNSSAPPVADPSGGVMGGGGRGGRHSRREKNRRYRRNCRTRSHLLICSWNAEGLRKKVLEVQRWLSDRKVDVAVIQEAQLPAGKNINIPGFQTANVSRRARGRRTDGPVKGGDVAIYIRDGLHYDNLVDRPLDASDDVTEWCGVRLFPPSSNSSQPTSQPASTKPIEIHNIYRPPIRSGVDDERTDRFALNITGNNANDYIITGDMNAHHPMWDHQSDEADAVGSRLAAWAAAGGWTVLNDGSPTHADYRGNTGAPDVTLCNRALARKCTWSIGEDLGSDHLPQLVEVSCHGGRPRRVRKTKWSFPKADWTAFSAGCEEKFASEPPAPDASTDQLLDYFSTTLISQSTKTIPRGARADPKPWAMDPDLVAAVEERREARDALRVDRSRAARERWTAAKRRAAEAEQEAKTRSFRDFTSNKLNQPANLGMVTKVLRKMEGATQSRPGHALQGDHGLAVGDLEKATSFARTYARVSRQVRAKRQDRVVKRELKEKRRNPCTGCNNSRRECCGPFTMVELEVQLRKMKSGKAPGPDNICAEHLRNLGPIAKELLLRLINQSWLRGEVPAEWRRAVIVPIPKAGKDPKLISSHRPIALTNHLAKLAERMVSARLTHIAEAQDLVPPEQVGFRRGRAAEENLARLIQTVQDGWNKPKPRGRPEDGVTADKFVLTAYDFSRAYDVIDHRMLRLKLLRLGLPACLVQWVWAFLRDRRASVEVNGVRSAERIFRAGLPQGSVLAPTLYTLWAADLVTDLKRTPRSSVYMYADDTATLCAGDTIALARERAQQSADIISQWAQKWKMKVAGEKTQVIVLSQWARDAKDLQIKVAGAAVAAGSRLRLLGVTFDRLLHFGQHCAELRRKVRPRTAQLRKLTGRTWGLTEAHLRTVANGYVRGALEFAASAWLPAASPSHVAAIDRELRAAARVVTGCTASTPVHALMAEAGMMGAQSRRRVLAARMVGLAASLPEGDPLRKVGHADPRRRLSTTSGWRDVGREALAAAGAGDVPVDVRLHHTIAPWKDTSKITINTDLGLGARRSASVASRRETAERRLAELPAEAVWIWSDGSANAGVADGGGGAVVLLPGGEEREVRVPAGRLCSSTRAELTALLEALRAVPELNPPEDLPAVVCLDSKAALMLLASGAAAQMTRLGADIWTELLRLSSPRRRVYLQWIPAHCGLPYNERADGLAKEAAGLQQSTTPVDVRTLTRAVHRHETSAWQAARPDGWYRSIMGTRLPPPVRLARREEAIDVHQIRTGHWGRSEQYLHRIGRRPTAACSQCDDAACPAGLCLVCREESDTPAHVLLRCPCLCGPRLRALGNIYASASDLRSDDVVAALAAGYAAHKSRVAPSPPRR